MDCYNILDTSAGFKILQTTDRSQSAVMVLEAGEASSEEPSRHPHSDQTLLVLEGEVEAEVAGDHRPMRHGDSIIVRANAAHRFVNSSGSRAVTFSVYSPPAYPAGTEA
jgi:mannose-6-phosphate isomerase-like protein (cupin superfamily)